MATNQCARIRYKTLDHCFRDVSKKYFISDLIEECKEALENEFGENSNITKRQIYKDIRFMQSEAGWAIQLESLYENKNKYYRYSEPKFSIENCKMSEHEQKILQESLQVLERIEGLPYFKWLNEAITRLNTDFRHHHTNHFYISFEENPFLHGRERLSNLFDAITQKKVLKITYQGVKMDYPETWLIHPHFLKQYNSRWFLLGISENIRKNITLPLDRILKIENSEISFIRSSINYNDYFHEIVGITHPKETKEDLITLEINSDLVPYIRTKPLHISQKIKGTKGNWTTIELQLIVNSEFINLIFSHGKSIRVTSPKSLKNRIKSEITEILQNYNEN
ncbi:WYL domain-containing protein [Halosquirtibacter laminarini]|uniref:WYL domain-containing protein n=1 Tax=Halosquirtibacter laminarini TaxID=3374600 RepID=A0AC61NHY9_9BACT|nr:WYL domain-containing protein [Prolixibacteraceae bacterium]